MAFDLHEYLSTSKALDLSDIQWSEAPIHPVSLVEIRSLIYMMDIEAHTLCYLRDLLNAGASADPEVADFLGCWLYEESYHGRAFERFLKAAGVDRSPAVCGARPFTLRDRVEQIGSALVSALTPDYSAVHMTWGAIQEITTLSAYRRMVGMTQNPILAEILARIIRQESRHFNFYYQKAAEKLGHPRTQRITSYLLRRLWTPVGGGVKSVAEVDQITLDLFGDGAGLSALRQIDRTMARLPGMDWFNLLESYHEAAASRQGKPPATSPAPSTTRRSSTELTSVP